MHDYRKLDVWKRSHQLVLDLYAATANFPGDERFGLRSQIRRAATSIPSNLAEAAGRGSDPDRCRFIHYAVGSSTELEYQVRLATDLGFLRRETSALLHAELGTIRGMLIALERSWRTWDLGT